MWLVLWVLIGVTLDGALLIGIWLLLDAIGPLPHFSQFWFDAVWLVAVPWLVHVVALPAILRMTWIKSDRLLLRTAAFIGLAAMLIPMLGIAIFICPGLPFLGLFYMIKDGSLSVAATPATWMDRAIDCGFWTAVATLVGVALGFLLHAIRPGGTTDHLPNYPRMRFDVLGGAGAALLAFAGMFLALSFGLFTRPVDMPTDWLHTLSVVPQLPATVAIGIMALLPHLLMVGNDLARFDLQRNEVGLAG
jgi:hypothetical protein